MRLFAQVILYIAVVHWALQTLFMALRTSSHDTHFTSLLRTLSRAEFACEAAAATRRDWLLRESTMPVLSSVI